MGLWDGSSSRCYSVGLAVGAGSRFVRGFDSERAAAVR